MDRLKNDLSDLGLNGDEAAAYLVLLGRWILTPTELATHAEITDPRACDVLESLAAKGLCVHRETSPRTYLAIDPKLALESLVRHRAEELERARYRTLQQADSLIAGLAPIFQAGRGEHDLMAAIEIVSDTNRIAALALSLAQATREQVRVCTRRPLVLTRGANWRYLSDLFERGIRYRAVYEQAALEDKELYGWMVNFKELGQEIQVVPTVPLKMQSFDDGAIMLALEDPIEGTASYTAIVRDRGMVAMLNLAFERLWEEGTPFEG
jgi:hypothetical protein